MICRIITGLVVLAWIAGLALFFINHGLHNDMLDLFTALILTPLGLPWNLGLIFLGGSEGMRTGLALGMPIINILIIWGLCKVVVRRFCPQGC